MQWPEGEVGAASPGLGQAPPEPVPPALAAVQRADHVDVGPDVLRRLFDAPCQHRVRAALDKQATAQRERLPDGRGETDRLTQVAEPVVRVQSGGVHRLAGHRGHEHRSRGDRPDRGELGADPVPQAVYRGGVGRVADRQHLGPVTVGVQRRLERCQRRGVAGDDDRTRPVLGGQRDPWSHAGGDHIGGRGDRQHAAAGQAADSAAAQRHDPGGVVQRQCAGDGRRRDLALRVSDHDIRRKTPAAPQRCERDRDRPQHRLHHVHPMEARGAGCLPQHVQHIEVHVRGERGRALCGP